MWQRVKPFAGLVRNDSFDYPVVIPHGSVFVTSGTDRRSSGTHYTPRSLTEPIVRYTLEPLVYIGPAEGKPENDWKLRSAKELLDLKICDMACGSGAFLVQACRFLAALVVEAWEHAEHTLATGEKAAEIKQLRITPFGEPATGKPDEQLIPKDIAERLIYAMRIVAQRCLYGVDKNPLAVEMAKLSLWLLTLAKDKPFEFLDHAIRGGDSLVGIHDMEQLRKFDLDVTAEQGRVVLQFLDRETKDAIALRRQIVALPANTVEDVERQEALLVEVKERMARLRCAADLLIGAEFITPDMSELLKEELDDESDDDDDARGPQWLKSKKASERFRRAARTRAAIDVAIHYQDSPLDEFQSIASTWRCRQTPFHWPLEFPEVIVERGGFDSFVGNPPFLGGTRISTLHGDSYADFLLELHRPATGNADLCAHFFRRAFGLLHKNGTQGLLATNTIAQGDTRDAALSYMVDGGGWIYSAEPSFHWPGTAAVEISVVHIAKSRFLGSAVLSGVPVAAISPLLDAGESLGEPYELAMTEKLCFRGSDVNGAGFFLTPVEAAQLHSTPDALSVLRPFLNAEEINSSPTQEPARWVINFGERSLEEARRFPELLAIVEERVKPERAKNNNKKRREVWWLFDRPKTELYEAICDLPEALMSASHTKYVSFVLGRTDLVYSHGVNVVASNDYWLFAVLQSTIHESWARRYGSSLEDRLRYTPSDCFRTFPFPSPDPRDSSSMPKLTNIGEEYHRLRQHIMVASHEGLTKTYNRFHDPNETSADIQKLRVLHVELDNAVAAAYCWSDLVLGHGFHETKQGVRYTISEPARREVPARLLKLNHDRYAEEVAQGLHDKKKARAATAAAAAERKKNAEQPKVVERGLFDDLDDLDTAFPQTDREKLLCAVYLDLVENQPGLRKSAYFDAILLAISPQRCEPMLTGPDRTAFRRAIKRIPSELTAASEVGVPWSDLVTTLTGNKSLVVSADGNFSLGTNFSDVRSSYPGLAPAFIQLLGKAASRLRELQGSTTPTDEPAAQVIREVNELRPIELRRAVTV